jgi:hypothetical protein
MPTSFILLVLAIPIHVTYFVVFSKLIAGLAEDERSRFVKSGRPVRNVLAIGGPLALLLVPATWIRVAVVAWLILFVPIATWSHHRRLAEAGFSSAFRARLLRLSILGAAGMITLLLALALL